MLYKATVHGDKSSDFKSRFNGNGLTITLLKLKNGMSIAAYLLSNSYKALYSDDSFLVNLNAQQIFKSRSEEDFKVFDFT